MFTSRCREVAVANGCSLLATALLAVLVERTGRGTHAASCGREHLGQALGEVAPRGGEPRAYSVATVGRCLLQLKRADLYRTKRRWSPGFVEPLPAWRYLSDKLLAAVGELATVRSRRRREQRQAADAPPPPPLYTSAASVGGCSSCHVIGDHLTGCPNAPPAG